MDGYKGCYLFRMFVTVKNGKLERIATLLYWHILQLRVHILIFVEVGIMLCECFIIKYLFMYSCCWFWIPLYLVSTNEWICLLGIFVVHVLVRNVFCLVVFLGMFDHYKWPYCSMFGVMFVSPSLG